MSAIIVGRETSEPNGETAVILRTLVDEFSFHFELNLSKMASQRFMKLFPLYLRTYGKLYAY